MTSGRKNLFSLAMLGAYFGLLLTGMPAQMAAQTPAVRSDEALGQHAKPDSESSMKLFAAAFEDLYRATSELGNSGRYSVDYFVSVAPNGSARYHSPTRGTKWSRKFLEPLRNLYDAFLPRVDQFEQNFLVEFNVSDDYVTLRTTAFTDEGSAAISPAALEQAVVRQRSSDPGSLRSQIYGAANVTVGKGKIIVVANLPRAGLEPLLTKSSQ